MTPKEKEDALQFAEEKLTEMVASIQETSGELDKVDRLKLQFICIQYTKNHLFRFLLDAFTTAFGSAHSGKDVEAFVALHEMFQEIMKVNKGASDKGVEIVEEQFRNWRKSR